MNLDVFHAFLHMMRKMLTPFGDFLSDVALWQARRMRKEICDHPLRLLKTIRLDPSADSHFGQELFGTGHFWTEPFGTIPFWYQHFLVPVPFHLFSVSSFFGTGPFSMPTRSYILNIEFSNQVSCTSPIFSSNLNFTEKLVLVQYPKNIPAPNASTLNIFVEMSSNVVTVVEFLSVWGQFQ